MATLALKDIAKTYQGGIQAVSQVSLDIADGEFVVFVGPSGCGKSTTLRMIAGLEEISAGEILIGDRVVNDVHPKDRDIAMVFQNYALYPHMTVYKNMAFALQLRKMPKTEIDRRVQHAARILELTDYLDRKPKALSGGQRQRVALGRAIVREPAAFLFDEPLSNLDAKLRVTTRSELKALHRRLRTTTVYVTHDQEEAMTLGDRVVVMAGGRIQQAASPLDIYARPANRFVAGFIGTPPMNFLEGTISTSHDIPTWQHTTGLTLALPEDLRNRARTSAGESAVLGIRPQAISLTHPKAPPATPGQHPVATWPGVIQSIEPLGADTDVRVALGDEPSDASPEVTARIASTPGITAGQRVTLRINPAGVHLFDPGETGQAWRSTESANTNALSS